MLDLYGALHDFLYRNPQVKGSSLKKWSTYFRSPAVARERSPSIEWRNHKYTAKEKLFIGLNRDTPWINEHIRRYIRTYKRQRGEFIFVLSAVQYSTVQYSTDTLECQSQSIALNLETFKRSCNFLLQYSTVIRIYCMQYCHISFSLYTYGDGVFYFNPNKFTVLEKILRLKFISRAPYGYHRK